MAQRSSRKRRKERQRAQRPPETPTAQGESGEAEEDPIKAVYARSRAKSDAVRAELKPLAAGERTTAVTVAAVTAGVLGVANLIAYFAGMEVQGERPAFAGIVIYTGLMFATAWGCWNMRYWAVLGMEALLGLSIVIFSLLLVKSESPLAFVIAIAMIGASGTLFWLLIKSMARIQMPERPGAGR